MISKKWAIAIVSSLVMWKIERVHRDKFSFYVVYQSRGSALSKRWWPDLRVKMDI